MRGLSERHRSFTLGTAALAQERRVRPGSGEGKWL